MVKVLFVCMGNICRSPTAQGVFQRLVQESALAPLISVDSAGTHAYHVGNRPDPRAQAASLLRGIDLSGYRARKVTVEDFAVFDYVLAMDRDNLECLREMCPPCHTDKLRLFLEFAPDLGETEVPDPYYGGPIGFERVLDLVEAAARDLLRNVREVHLTDIS